MHSWKVQTQDLELNCGFEDLELQLQCFLLKTPEQEGQTIDLLCENPSAGGPVQKQRAWPSPVRLGGASSAVFTVTEVSTMSGELKGLAVIERSRRRTGSGPGGSGTR